MGTLMSTLAAKTFGRSIKCSLWKYVGTSSPRSGPRPGGRARQGVIVPGAQNVKIATTNKIGRLIGSRMLMKNRHGPAPSSFAASNISTGNPRM